MTPEEIEALKKRAEDAEAAAKLAQDEADAQKKAAEDALSVNKTLQEQLIKVGQEVKSDLPKIKFKNKTYVFKYPNFRSNGTDYKSSEIKSSDEELIEELISSEVLVLVK